MIRLFAGALAALVLLAAMPAAATPEKEHVSSLGVILPGDAETRDNVWIIPHYQRDVPAIQKFMWEDSEGYQARCHLKIPSFDKTKVPVECDRYHPVSGTFVDHVSFSGTTRWIDIGNNTRMRVVDWEGIPSRSLDGFLREIAEGVWKEMAPEKPRHPADASRFF